MSKYVIKHLHHISPVLSQMLKWLKMVQTDKSRHAANISHNRRNVFIILRVVFEEKKPVNHSIMLFEARKTRKLLKVRDFHSREK